MNPDQQLQPQPGPPTVIGGSETQTPEGYVEGDVNVGVTGYTSLQMTCAVPGTGNASYHQGQAPLAGFQPEKSPIKGGCDRCCTAVGVFGCLFAIYFIWIEIDLISLDKRIDNGSQNYATRVCLLIGKILNLIANVVLIVSVTMRRRLPCLVWIFVTVNETVFHTAASLNLNYKNRKYGNKFDDPVIILGRYICHLVLQLSFVLLIALFVKKLNKQLTLDWGHGEWLTEMPAAVQTENNTGSYPSTCESPSSCQTLTPQPLIQTSDGMDFDAGPAQPVSLATKS